MTGPRLAVIVAAGGSGERFGDVGGKQLAPVLGKPLLSWTVAALDGPPVDMLVVVCNPLRVTEYSRQALESIRPTVTVATTAGGESRQESIARGLALVPDSVEFVAVHDGARPLVSLDMINDAVEHLRRSGADGVVVGHPCYDTLKHVDGTRVLDTPDRSIFWIAQTPQVFRRATLVSAHKLALSDGFHGTDDASLIEHWGGKVEMVLGARDNIKVTTAHDIRFVEAALRDRQERD